VQIEPGETYLFRRPMQEPIDPPYLDACMMRKKDELAKPPGYATGHIDLVPCV